MQFATDVPCLMLPDGTTCSLVCVSLACVYGVAAGHAKGHASRPVERQEREDRFSEARICPQDHGKGETGKQETLSLSQTERQGQ